MEAKPILRATVGIQSLALLGRAVKLIPKKFISDKKKMREKPKLVKEFVDVLVGTSLIKPAPTLVNSL